MQSCLAYDRRRSQGSGRFLEPHRSTASEPTKWGHVLLQSSTVTRHPREDGERPARVRRSLTAASAGGLVGLHDRLRDAPAVVHLVAVLASPLADRRGLLAARPNGLVLDR